MSKKIDQRPRKLQLAKKSNRMLALEEGALEQVAGGAANNYGSVVVCR